MIDLSRIIRFDEAVLPVSVDLAFRADEIGQPVNKIETPFHVEGQVKNVRDVLTFEGTITGRFMAECSRCNEGVSVDFSCGFEEVILKQAQEGIEEGILVVNDTIDIRDAMLFNIIINLPMRYLCDKNCKGLCPVCGKDLNIALCNCEDAQIDERLKVLQRLLDDEALQK